MFNFDEVISRRGSDSYKWDSAADPEMLPMWVADMDFPTAPVVIDALQTRAAHGMFGYTKVPERYFDAVIQWFSRRYGFTMPRDGIIFTTGVVPALSAVIQALCQLGEGVIVQTPAYNCFFSSIRNSQCRQIDSPLRYQDGEYTIDFEDLERKAADPSNTMLLLCNPHNPVGRAWTREELQRIGDICLANNVTVLSDEIHCDLVSPSFQHIPFASVDERFLVHSVTCTSPSKAFNLAGLHVANILAADAEKYRLIDKQININEVCEIGPFAVEALIAAYNRGEAWLDALRDYIKGNYDIVQGFIAEHLPQLKVAPQQATYLAWIDVSALGISCAEVAKDLYDQHKLWVSEGTVYGAAGEGFIRMNLATPRVNVIDGLNRLKAAFANDHQV